MRTDRCQSKWVSQKIRMSVVMYCAQLCVAHKLHKRHLSHVRAVSDSFLLSLCKAWNSIEPHYHSKCAKLCPYSNVILRAMFPPTDTGTGPDHSSFFCNSPDAHTHTCVPLWFVGIFLGVKRWRTKGKHLRSQKCLQIILGNRVLISENRRLIAELGADFLVLRDKCSQVICTLYWGSVQLNSLKFNQECQHFLLFKGYFKMTKSKWSTGGWGDQVDCDRCVRKDAISDWLYVNQVRMDNRSPVICLRVTFEMMSWSQNDVPWWGLGVPRWIHNVLVCMLTEAVCISVNSEPLSRLPFTPTLCLMSDH